MKKKKWHRERRTNENFILRTPYVARELQIHDSTKRQWTWNKLDATCDGNCTRKISNVKTGCSKFVSSLIESEHKRDEVRIGHIATRQKVPKQMFRLGSIPMAWRPTLTVVCYKMRAILQKDVKMLPLPARWCVVVLDGIENVGDEKHVPQKTTSISSINPRVVLKNVTE